DETRRHVLTGEHDRLTGGPRREHPLFDPIHERRHDGAVLVDHRDARLDHVRLRSRLDRPQDHVDIVGVEEVVAAEDRDVRRRRTADGLAIVLRDAEVPLVAHIGDAIVVDRGEPPRDRLIGIAVVDHDQAPVGIALGADRGHRLEQQVGVAPEGTEDLQGHPSTPHPVIL
ncbi:hypothetical protein ABE10_00275, partial [Bacillus toyonensis]|nr:hypothetical protein [Bacillus toyonensis]